MSRREAAPTIPHIRLPLFLRWLPRRHRHLPGTRHGELVRRRVLADRRAGADVGAARDAHRGDQRGVGADEAVVLDDGAALGGAVVVAGDGAGTDVHLGADVGIADVAEMVRLRAPADAARLHLDEVADVHLVAEAVARAQARKGAEAAARADLGVLEVREGEDLGAGPDAHVAQEAVGADAYAVGERDLAFENAIDVDRYVGSAGELAAYVDA